MQPLNSFDSLVLFLLGSSYFSPLAQFKTKNHQVFVYDYHMILLKKFKNAFTYDLLFNLQKRNFALKGYVCKLDFNIFILKTRNEGVDFFE